MTENVKKYLDLSKREGTKEERKKMLEKMTNKEIDYLINQAGNQTAKIYFAKYKK